MIDPRKDTPGRQPPCPPGSRRRPLPETLPKHEAEDAEARSRIRAILDSPTYRRADNDPEFLERDELRATRLQLEFLKPELALADAGISATIVVFGGTRVVEPAAARRELTQAREAAEALPDNPDAARALAIAERVAAKSRYYQVARELGRLVGRRSLQSDGRGLAIMTGGGPGLMEAANRGAHDVGARSVGLNITLPMEQYPNPYISPELTFRFRYFALRKMHFMQRARALVAFPGGYGTFDELFETLCLVQTRTSAALPIILVGEEYWRNAVDLEFLVREGTIDAEDLELVSYAESADEIWRSILAWYEQAGEPLIPTDGRPRHGHR